MRWVFFPTGASLRRTPSGGYESSPLTGLSWPIWRPTDACECCARRPTVVASRRSRTSCARLSFPSCGTWSTIAGWVLVADGQGPVYAARFLSDDKVVTGCGDGAFRTWSAATGQLLQTYRGGSRFLVDATLSADGTMLIGGGGDG